MRSFDVIRDLRQDTEVIGSKIPTHLNRESGATLGSVLLDSYCFDLASVAPHCSGATSFRL